MADLSLDCRDLNCPMPIVMISKAVKSLAPGQTVDVQATDMAFRLDLEAWAARTGHKVISFEAGDVAQATIEVIDAKQGAACGRA